MSGPLARIGQALRRFFGRGQPVPQRAYKEYVEPMPEATREEVAGHPISEPTAWEQQHKAYWRVGLNPKQRGSTDPKTGERFLTGSKATKAGVLGALDHVPPGATGRVELRVYGHPLWPRKKESPRDLYDNTYIGQFVDRVLLEQGLQDPRMSLDDLIYQLTGYNFGYPSETGKPDEQGVITVWVASGEHSRHVRRGAA